jgi:hypothetical protein
MDMYRGQARLNCRKQQDINSPSSQPGKGCGNPFRMPDITVLG